MRREVKSVFRNVPGQASRWQSPDDWEGILGRGKPGNPVQHLHLFSSLYPPPSCLSRPFSQPVFVSCSRVTASLSAIKTLYNRGGTVMGKEAYVTLVEHGKQQNPLLHISAAAGRVHSENPSDGRLEKLFTVTHQLLIHSLRRVFCGAERADHSVRVNPRKMVVF